MGVVREIRENLDYGAVINTQLSRIAYLRTNLYVVIEGQLQRMISTEDGFRNYLLSVEALYAILLPELKANAEKYLDLARLLYLYYREYFDKRRKHLDVSEVKKKIEDVKAKLPNNVLEKISSSPSIYHWLAFIVDLALEEMLKKLNEAGLLLGGKKVTVKLAGK